ncbi:Receptor-type guanylate cyclase gcy [Seminavis robusta]|uniref:Receptor-type guanylate cyclase gcy n=1 Tax=Seminavis robusta TaxID=568900 RepID=A0A9N8H9C0_9STRA|nr:Receptor-type guanylate cyclase gcy [Seminavis robusta]|eukprot:Sro270_g104180.1 Receptor-type guanylate cyclase gcy (1363) ;mRNA; f:12497-18634
MTNLSIPPSSQLESGSSRSAAGGDAIVRVHTEDSCFEEEEEDEEEASLTSPSDTAQNDKQSTQKYTRRIKASKILVFLILAMAVIVASILARTSRLKAANAETKFVDFAQDVIMLSTSRINTTAAALKTFSNSVTSLAIYGQAQWPFVTLPDFAVRSKDFTEATQADAISLAPFVASQHKLQWEAYAKQAFPNQQHIWRESYRVGKPPRNDLTGGPFLPVWQTQTSHSQTQVANTTALVNFNLLSDTTIQKAIDVSLETHMAALSGLLDYDAVFGGTGTGTGTHAQNGSAHSMMSTRSILAYPIHRNFEANSTVVAFLMAVLPWEVLLRPEARKHYHATATAVLMHQCSGTEPQAVTFALNGDQVKTLGPGDLHDERFSHHQVSSVISLPEANCRHSIHLYPSSSTDIKSADHSLTSTSVILLLLLLMAIGAFITYDAFVQRRNRQVVQVASQTSKIISSLFPKTVHDRLFQADESNLSHSTRRRRGRRRQSFQNKYQPAKKNLAHFLSDESKTSQTSGETNIENGEQAKSKPIADLFPETTVMFCDIAGFTAWSSSREACDVFVLLETVYNAFDQIAKRRKVFKVETIGDCYLAVAGLPTPRKDHAVVMVRFASDCLVEFNCLSKDLELKLGPGTSDLAMRFGLHSGPTTAGVLRGEKTRFQLFGDTVNTASRMESTGEREKIQVSTTTANLLAEARKSHWCEQRKDPVVAKGKGEMITYWVNPKTSLAGHQPSYSECSGEESRQESPDTGNSTVPKGAEKASLGPSSHESVCAPPELPEDHVDPKLQRSITWISGVLLGLLRQIVARRLAMGKKSVGQTQATRRARMAMQPEPGLLPLDELEDIINVPKFNPKAAKNVVDPESVELPCEVIDQMHSFVTVVALMYRSQPFHNWFHAAHVTQSVSKLLARIVAPDDMEAEDLDRHSKRRAFHSKLHDWSFGLSSDPLIQFTIIFAAMIHDADHPGVPNSALVKSRSPMAEHFRNQSIAEQNSLEITWDLLMDDAYADLCACIFTNEGELHRFRSLLVNAVLATDIQDAELNRQRKARWDKAFHSSSVSAAPTPGVAEFVSVADDQNRKATIVLEHMIQASDVAHTMQHWQVYLDFNEKLFHEMTEAYKNGHLSQDPAKGWYKGELGFFDHYIIPLANKLSDCGVFGVSSAEFLCYALDNRSEWERQGRSIVDGYVRKYGMSASPNSSCGLVEHGDDGSCWRDEVGNGVDGRVSSLAWSDEKMGACRDLERGLIGTDTSHSIKECSTRAVDRGFQFTNAIGDYAYAHAHVDERSRTSNNGSVRSIFGESDHNDGGACFGSSSAPGISTGSRHGYERVRARTNDLDVNLRSSTCTGTGGGSMGAYTPPLSYSS